MEVIWFDDHMLELNITASNGRYFGTTEVYDTKESLLDLARDLNGFPFNKRTPKCKLGDKDLYAFFEVDFKNVLASGKCGVVIKIEENTGSEYRENEKDKLCLELFVEPSAIDLFAKELMTMAHRQNGVAVLNGTI